jgi:glycosyltransferase involved in cell wall biosynthesis
LRRWSYGRLDAVVALTNQSAAWLADNTAARRLHVIPNPVAWPMEAASPAIPPDSVGLAGRRRLLAVGRLAPQKGFDLLIGAFAACARSFPEWELVIVGDGPSRAELEAQIEALGLGDRVFLAGRAGNIGAWYERADAYVLSSRFEGMPNVLLEAMSHGLPVISFDCETGPRELIRHGIDGLLVPPQDPKALAEAMAALMGDGPLRLRLGTRAVETRQRHALETIEAQWVSFFLELHAERARSPT